MPNKKITQLASAEATFAAIFPVVVSGQNQQLGLRDMVVGLGIPQYVEATVRATATVADLPRCNIFDMYAKVWVNGTASEGNTVNIGTLANAGRFAQISIGASNTPYFVRADAGEVNTTTGLQGVSGAIIAAVPSASANAAFIVGIGYFRT